MDDERCEPLYTPSTWREARPRRMTSRVVESVLAACRKIDDGATLASATYTQDGQTLVRIRSSASGSVTFLRRALQASMPLSVTDVTDSPLDGTCEASVTVPQGVDEQRAARRLIQTRLVPRMLFNVGVLLVVAGVGGWISGMLSEMGIGVADAREL